MDTDLFEKELATYEKNKELLLAKHRGKYVLIKGDQIFGVFDTQADAARVGYEKIGVKPFLIKKVLENDLHQ